MAQNSPVPHWDLGIGPITCFAWNKDRTQLAMSASGSEIYIFEFVNSTNVWKCAHILREHDLMVTGIDWAPNMNRIVSCSHDKNAFVWTLENGIWKPELVLVRTNRAATCVKWSPQENKFAVGTGAKLVAICYYEKENNWWVSKQMKKPFRSTVTSLDWHPNNVLLAVGACDFRVRVFSAYVKEVDEKPDPNPWGSKMPFGQILMEYKSLGWVNDVVFSPSGCRLAWVSHDSSLAVIDKNDQGSVEPIIHKSSSLPFTTVIWINEHEIVTAGHDCQPTLFAFEENKTIRMVAKLDVPPESKNSNVNTAFQMFRNFARTAADSVEGVQLKTLHQNAITQVKPYYGKMDNVIKFATCGSDGIVAIWDVKNRAAKVR